jgi:acyl-CoA:6-aminopenicillanic acid acyl transferase
MTGATVLERRLDETPWLVVHGERLAAFEALGSHARDEIMGAVQRMPDLVTLRRRLELPSIAGLHSAVAAQTRRAHPREWAELTALARGARVAFDDLLLLNLRGDLGTEDGTGCSDLGYVGHGAGFVAHNEDGADVQLGTCRLLTLAIDGDVPVTTWWYPGFVPANTFTVTGNGLAWGIDHIGVRDPRPAPGRHFVARAAQHQATRAGVVRHLTANPGAGGFAYTIGRVGHPEVTLVETAAGHARAIDLHPGDRPFCWHTNHLLHLPSELDTRYANSVDRARFLDGLSVPERPDAAWFLSVLAGATLPHGVLRAGDSGTVTLATFVIDLAQAEATVLPAGGHPVTVPVADLVAGVADRQRVLS